VEKLIKVCPFLESMQENIHLKNIENDIKELKLLILKDQAKKPLKLKGLLKDIEITGQDMQEAKTSLFSRCI
jgi:hypothetical protein